MQTTLTRIFIVLESVLHGLSENSDEISRKARKFEGFFRPKSSDLQKKKTSSPKLRLIFRPNSEIQTFEGGCFPMGGAIFNFLQKIALKSTKNVRFCILHKPMGGLEPPRPPWLRYCLLIPKSINQLIPKTVIETEIMLHQR